MSTTRPTPPSDNTGQPDDERERVRVPVYKDFDYPDQRGTIHRRREFIGYDWVWLEKVQNVEEWMNHDGR